MSTRLLVVDDDPANCLLVTRCMAHLPEIKVVTAESGADAWKRLTDEWPFACILVDWNMPEMSGDELVQRVRAHSQFEGLRILMLTAQTSLGHVKQALKSGADEYLMKPYTREMLLKKLLLLGIG